LSLATAVNVAVALWLEVVTAKEEGDTEKLVMVGAWSSVLVTETVSVSVELFPAASDAVKR
jgi:predicted outer membrane lipoprotein